MLAAARRVAGRVPAALGCELALAALAAGYHVALHRALPRGSHPVANLAVGGLGVGLARGAGATWSDMGLERRQAGHGLRAGLTAMGAIGAVIAVAAALPPTRRFLVDERVAGADGRQAAYETLLRIPFSTALFEEVLFRGACYGLLARRLPVRRAAVASSLLFGCWHVLPTLDGLDANPAGDYVASRPATAAALGTGIAATGAAGLGFAWLRERSGSLLAPYLAHVATNSFGYLAATLVARRGRTPSARAASRQGSGPGRANEVDAGDRSRVGG